MSDCNSPLTEAERTHYKSGLVSYIGLLEYRDQTSVSLFARPVQSSKMQQ